MSPRALRLPALCLALATCDGPCVLDYEPVAAACGDGTLDDGEECDDGNAVDDDDCSAECFRPRLVFATAGTFDGALGSLQGADDRCAAAAAAAGLGGPDTHWLAWLGDGAIWPETRFDAHFTGWYRLPDGTDIARGWADLTDGALLHPIDQNPHGDPITGEPRYAWTNVGQKGDAVDTLHCAGWTSNDIALKGRVGSLDATNRGWTQDGALITCDTPNRLLCFEQ